MNMSLTIDEIQKLLMELEELEDKLTVLELDLHQETNPDRKALLMMEIEKLQARIEALRIQLK